MTDISCLLVIDVQKGIFGLKQLVYNGPVIIRNISTAVAWARKNNIRVVFSRHENSTFLKKGSNDWNIVDELKPADGELIIPKKHPGIFQDTDLYSTLQKDRINRLIVAGLISNGCIREACLEALGLKFEVTLLKDGHSTFYKNAARVIEDVNTEMEDKGVVLKSSDEL